MKRLTQLFLGLLSLTFLGEPVLAQQNQQFCRIRDGQTATSLADVQQLTINFPATTWGLVGRVGSYFYDGTGAQWRYWSGLQAATNLTALPVAPQVMSLPYFYSISSTDLELWRGDPANSDAIAATTEMPYVGGFNYFYDADDTAWRRVYGLTLDNETIANTYHAPFFGGMLYAYDPDNTTWRWLHVEATISDAMPLTNNALVTTSAMMGYNGATLDMVRVGAAGEVQMTDVATRPGEDAGNDWRKVKKEETAVYNPAATTGTAVDSTTDTILASVEVLSYPNFCVWVKNAGGGSADAFTGVDIDASPDGTEWVDINWSACDTLASGDTCVYCVSGNAYRYVRVQAVCGAGDDTTADAWITANKN